MNAAELIAELSKFPPDTPVVMAMESEPMGDYEVLNVVVGHLDCPHPQDSPKVWDAPYAETDPAELVALLGYDRPPRTIVDVELPEPKAVTP